VHHPVPDPEEVAQERLGAFPGEVNRLPVESDLLVPLASVFHPASDIGEGFDPEAIIEIYRDGDTAVAKKQALILACNAGAHVFPSVQVRSTDISIQFEHHSHRLRAILRNYAYMSDKS